MDEIILKLEIDQLSRKSKTKQVFLLIDLLNILSNDEFALFERIISSRKAMAIFIKRLIANEKNIIAVFQRSKKHRGIVFRKFEKTVTNNWPGPPPYKWNLWIENLFDYHDVAEFLRSTESSILNDVDLIFHGPQMQIPYFDLSERHLHDRNLYGANLNNTNLMGSNLDSSDLTGANASESLLGFQNLQAGSFDNANLHSSWIICADVGHATEDSDHPMLRASTFEHTDFTDAVIVGVDFRYHWLAHAKFESAKMPYIDFSYSNLYHADFTGAYMRGARLQGADLRNATFVNTNLADADISGSKVYGTSAWNVNLKGAVQKDLIVTPDGEPTVKVDNLKLAQFIYLLLDKSEIAKSIETIADNAVLILGRFEPERKVILEAIKEELRNNYLPIIFDFEGPQNRDSTEVIRTLASMVRFVIADLSDPNSVPSELMSFVEGLPSVPVQPIFSPIPGHRKEYPNFDHLARYPQVLPIYRYSDQNNLLIALRKTIIKSIEAKVVEVRPKPKSIKIS